MIRFVQVVVAVLFLSLGNNAMAGALAYTCEVVHVYSLSTKGALEISAWEKDMKGSSFSVSRSTGEIIGEVIPTLMAKSTRVVNKGSKENSFKATADFGEQYQLLEVQEFRDGALKPFVSSSMGGAGIVTGSCK
ncbi:MAG: hypothetical protein HY807_07125 [Nitrospirae bacterium]|nr:hypothetical protein [Nitrospirota bacterium]